MEKVPERPARVSRFGRVNITYLGLINEMVDECKKTVTDLRCMRMEPFAYGGKVTTLIKFITLDSGGSQWCRKSIRSVWWIAIGSSKYGILG